ncbi:MAG: polysaccharide biosynthesis tyrosine autokinase [Akkermansiaceae bacterium]
MTNKLDPREKTLIQMRRWREGDLMVEGDMLPEEESTGEGVLHLKDLIPRILARWHWIAIGLLLGMSLALFGVWRAVPIYRAKATLLVKAVNVDATGKQAAEDLNLNDSRAMNTVMATVLNFDLAELVAADEQVRTLKGLVPVKRPLLSLSKGKPGAIDQEVPEAAILAKWIQEWLKVSIRKDTRLIDLSVEHPEPEVAMVIANKLVEHFIKHRELDGRGRVTGSLVFLRNEEERIRGKLGTDLALRDSYATSLKAEKELAAAEEEIADLSLRYRHKHPKMMEAVARLQQKREHFVAMLERAVRVLSDRDYWKEHLARLGSPDDPDSMREYRELLDTRNVKLQIGIDSESSRLENLLDEMGNQEVTEKVAEAEVRSDQEARLPEHTVYPNKIKMLIQGAAMGLMAGVGLAFLFQYFDNKLHTVAEVESVIGLPVLASLSIMEFKGKEDDPEVDETEQAWTSRPDGWSPEILFQEGKSKSHYAEMFRVLRTSISLLGPVDKRKITLITSALPSEGKTLVAVNLAVAMAQQGLRTLLIDFDLRKPSVHKMFGVTKDDRPGLAELLVGTAQSSEVVRTETGQANLSLILVGSIPPNPGELLESSRLDEWLKKFREEYDHIVLDTAPLLPVPDTRILAPLADNRCLIVRAESTPRGAVNRAVSTLKSSGVYPEGIVFNGYVEKRFLIGANYSYGYYRYGRYNYGYGKYKYGYGSYGSVYGERDPEDED